MTPDEMRRAAVLLSDTDAYNMCSSDEADDLARLLREEADRAPDAERYRKLRTTLYGFDAD